MSQPVPLPPDGRVFLFGLKFVRLNAMAIADWLDNKVPKEERHSAANALGWRWLRFLVPAMSEPHALSESPNFYLLTVPNAEEVRRLLRFLEETREKLFRSLASAAPPRERPKHLVIICGDKLDYDEFSALEHPGRGGELADSSGVFVGKGLPHIALSSALLNDIHAILVHELVHDCISHLPLPLWLNEGITQLLEYQLVSWRPFVLDRETMEKHKAHWNAETIQLFWSGRSFFNPGDSQFLSYNLSVVLARKIMTNVARGQSDFWSFVRQARPSDAGDAAMRAQFGVGVEELVEDFLGPGAWRPASVKNPEAVRVAFRPPDTAPPVPATLPPARADAVRSARRPE